VLTLQAGMGEKAVTPDQSPILATNYVYDSETLGKSLNFAELTFSKNLKYLDAVISNPVQ